MTDSMDRALAFLRKMTFEDFRGLKIATPTVEGIVDHLATAENPELASVRGVGLVTLHKISDHIAAALLAEDDAAREGETEKPVAGPSEPKTRRGHDPKKPPKRRRRRGPPVWYESDMPPLEWVHVYRGTSLIGAYPYVENAAAKIEKLGGGSIFQNFIVEYKDAAIAIQVHRGRLLGWTRKDTPTSVILDWAHRTFQNYEPIFLRPRFTRHKKSRAVLRRLPG